MKMFLHVVLGIDIGVLLGLLVLLAWQVWHLDGFWDDFVTRLREAINETQPNDDPQTLVAHVENLGWSIAVVVIVCIYELLSGMWWLSNRLVGFCEWLINKTLAGLKWWWTHL